MHLFSTINLLYPVTDSPGFCGHNSWDLLATSVGLMAKTDTHLLPLSPILYPSVSLSTSAGFSNLPSRVTQSRIPEQWAPFTILLLGRPWLLYLPIHSYTETPSLIHPSESLECHQTCSFLLSAALTPKDKGRLLLLCVCSSIGTSSPNNQMAVVLLHLLCLQVERTPLET